MKVIITIDGRIVVDIDTESVPSASLPVLEVAEKPTPLTDEAQTTLDITHDEDRFDDIIRMADEPKPDTTPGAIGASPPRTSHRQWTTLKELMGDIRIEDIKPSGIKIIRCSICRRTGFNARSHPDHGGLGPA